MKKLKNAHPIMCEDNQTQHWHFGPCSGGSGFWWVKPKGHEDDTDDDRVFWFDSEDDADTACRALNLYAHQNVPTEKAA